MAVKLLHNVSQLATCLNQGGQGDIHVIPRGALVWEQGRLLWVGPERDLPSQYGGAQRIDAGGGLVIPGLIDAHTHLAFGGWRADEFVQRIQGRSYLDIARDGGGILGTVRATRAAGEEELAQRAAGFVEEMLALGVTTVECKSGYGLTEPDELKLLRVYARLAREQPVRLVPTLLGAHVVPPEFRSDRQSYLELLTGRLIPGAARAGLAQFCDVFVEESAFSVEEGRRLLDAGRRAGLGSKVHADQLSDSGGAELAAEVGAVSADHLECVSPAGIRALAAAGVVAVTLPLAALYLNQDPAPARDLIRAGVPVAVASDFNPGTAPSYHLPLALTLACIRQRMTPAEALKGATIYAARAVGRQAELGSLEPGKAADFAILDASTVEQWLYHLRPNACVMTVIAGVPRWTASSEAHSS
jgi:imidazolonepropionase